MHVHVISWCTVSRKYTPPPLFCNLSLSTKCSGGLYAGCKNFSRDYTLPSDKAWPHCHCWWGWRASVRQRDAPNASGRLTSFIIIWLQDKSSSGGAYAQDKNTSAGLCAKNGGGGGLMCEGGHICGTLWYHACNQECIRTGHLSKNVQLQ